MFTDNVSASTPSAKQPASQRGRGNQHKAQAVFYVRLKPEELEKFRAYIHSLGYRRYHDAIMGIMERSTGSSRAILVSLRADLIKAQQMVRKLSKSIGSEADFSELQTILSKMYATVSKGLMPPGK